jgi:hypothetical protein
VEYVIGIVLALAVTGSATALGFDRERVFYPAVMIVIASYYILFGVIGGSAPVLIAETAVAAGFMLLAVIGFKSGLWLVVVALASHGVFDFIHQLIIDDPGVPRWWPGFCLAFDIAAAVYLAFLLKRNPRLAYQAGLK